jgi:hypothetical protein
MASIDLPRALQDYFAFAETTATRNGRRFSITLPYVRPDGRLDKLQWWYHLSPAREKALGDGAPDALRTEAIARFKVHIERWLQNTAQVMYGDSAIPQVSLQGTRTTGDHPLVSPLASEADVAPPSPRPETVWVDSGDGYVEIIENTSEHAAAEKTAFG